MRTIFFYCCTPHTITLVLFVDLVSQFTRSCRVNRIERTCSFECRPQEKDVDRKGG